MAIKISMGRPVIICDRCNKQIEDAYQANVEWETPPIEEIDVFQFLHQRCSKGLYPGRGWMPLTDFLLLLHNNASFSRSQQGPAWELLEAKYRVGFVE